MRKKRNMLVAGILCVSMIATMFWMDMSKADDAPNYSYIQDYTLGYDEDQGIMVYTGGVSSEPIEKVEGARVYDYQDDNPFAPEDEQSWDVKDLRLTQPVQYTTSDGKVHNIESMLTNFNFIADPTSIDNSDVDGKLYVYGTTEAIEYKNGGYMSENAYNNESLTILSTSDMVNWTDEGCMYSQNLTNEPSYSTDKVKVGFGKKAWAPSGLKIDGDGDGDDEYYIFYTDGGGAVAYVQGESPTGPWKDDLGKVLFTRNTANCSGVVWCFDPAVLVDDKGDAYVYFGGGMYSDTQYGSMSDYDRYENAKTGRVCKIKFEEGTGAVSMDGVPQELETYYFYEDSEINQFDGLYYYSYCTNDKMSEDDKWIGKREIAVYISSDPMNIAFQPTTENGDQYTDEDGVYHNYLGAVLDNPSTLYGEYYNNHHRMLSFKGHNYIIYHSTALNNAIYRASNKYRSLHVDEIKIDTKKEEISITLTYDGASQIENFNPFYEFDGSKKHINATTSSYSAGVKSRRSDRDRKSVV